MLPLLVIRPQPGCAATVAAALALGLAAEGYPLFAIEPRAWIAPDPAGYDALLVGSANAVRHAGPGLAALRALPVLAVGAASAAAAREAGLVVEATGGGGLQGVVDSLGTGRRLLRLAGDERVPLHRPPRTVIDEVVVYAARALPVETELAARLRAGAVVAVHSGEAARHLAAQCAMLGIRRAPLRLAALAPRIVAAAGEGWGEVAIAAHPDDEALLALARQMCQDG